VNLDNGEFFDLLTNYNSSVIKFGGFYPQQMSLGETSALRATIISIKGLDLLLKIGGSFYVLPFKQAMGKVLTPMRAKEVQRQTTFSDYAQQEV
jgi:hypothetical protein